MLMTDTERTLGVPTRQLGNGKIEERDNLLLKERMYSCQKHKSSRMRTPIWRCQKQSFAED